MHPQHSAACTFCTKVAINQRRCRWDVGILLHRTHWVCFSSAYHCILLERAGICPPNTTSKELKRIGTNSHHYSVAEVTCGIICGCLPAMPAFLRHISGLKVKIKPTSWRSTTRQPINDTEKARGGSTVLPPTPTVASKSPAYIASIATNGKTERNGSRYHLWEELDELEYVAGDDKRQIYGV